MNDKKMNDRGVYFYIQCDIDKYDRIIENCESEYVSKHMSFYILDKICGLTVGYARVHLYILIMQQNV